MKSKIFSTVCLLLLASTSYSSPDSKTHLEEMDIYVSLYKSYFIRTGKRAEKASDLTNEAGIRFGKDDDAGNGETGFTKFLNRVSTSHRDGSYMMSYFVRGSRVDGESFDSPLPVGAKISAIYTDKFVKNIGGEFPSGEYVVMWNDYSTSVVPYDLVIYSYQTPTLSSTYSYKTCFDGDYADLPNAVSYQEYFFKYNLKFPPPFRQKFKDKPSNGGLESLVQFSRRQNFPDIYGISHEDVWDAFDNSPKNITLAEFQAGTKKLGLDTQVVKMSLAQLAENGTSAMLSLKDDGRIVTLSAIDGDRAVVIDRGLIRNLTRSVVENRYSGEALVPVKSLTQSAGIVAEDAVRAIQLDALEAEVPQSVTLRNTGKTPITLQLEYPILGATESKLSKAKLAPGETATLDLKVKWRSVLKAPTQNVFVNLQTSDPIVPRLQLAFLLVPPAPAN